MGLFDKKSKSAAARSADNSILHKHLDFTASEQYRLLRANIMFTLPEDVKCPIIGVTSSIRGEGKTTTAINLSYVIAERGRKVLLIDGDLRLPSVAKRMEVSSTPGLTNLLVGNGADVNEWCSQVNPNWYILPSGDIPPNPSELLGSRRMENTLEMVREYFDYIIIDLPPVNLVSDAVVISRMLTGMLLVIREDYTSKKELEQCFRQLNLSNVNVLGCVMNGSEHSQGSYKRYGKYGRYGRYGHYGKYYKSAYYAQTQDASPDELND